MRTVGPFMRERPDFWFLIADTLSEVELEALIRAITVAERDIRGFTGAQRFVVCEPIPTSRLQFGPTDDYFAQKSKRFETQFIGVVQRH